MRTVHFVSGRDPNGFQLSGSGGEKPSLATLCYLPYLLHVVDAMQLSGDRHTHTRVSITGAPGQRHTVDLRCQH